MKKSALSLYFFVVLLTSSCAQKVDKGINLPSQINFTAESVVDGLQNPWGMAFLPDGSILITEKSGKLIHFKEGKKVEVANTPEVYDRGQGGFMDVELHPDYAQNGWIYFSYSSTDGEGSGANTAIMRAKLRDNQLTNKEILYKGVPNTTRGHHFGSRLEFDDEGYLYFSIGDRGNRDENPQDITRDGGKIYRLHDDGRIPTDNPFVGKSGAKTAIYSYGHRNPQGLTKHPKTGEIWEHEHGPRGGDEINIIEKGKNYGWPVITYGINYSGTKITDETTRPGMEQPIYYWVPSIAPSGMTFVSSDKYPYWKGNLLVGSLAFQYLERLVLENNKVTYREKLLDGMGRVRNVRQAPDGHIYVGIEGKGIYRLEPK
ncbi:PQQ-dependent sugar dehydrogenase [Flagellimonas lutaonensis]|uniref:Glucose/sorbosone dehydrogenase n=1 Tax=Flagellimonas lutaonensis TaxID=516051 RepID=A0A0D5YPQ2_9FLAO|nr:PQQ-dependent sugar dehydrogenase [Allomuricauda lutaonensis]AKA33919.1 glucose/sorbosone dehydrogenase [Allomuricauda lutaonensis]